MLSYLVPLFDVAVATRVISFILDSIVLGMVAPIDSLVLTSDAVISVDGIVGLNVVGGISVSKVLLLSQ